MTGPLDLSGYDPLDERHRWCIYCGADCWPEPDNQQHDRDCAFVTGLYPVTDNELTPWGSYGGCCLCHTEFVPGDTYMLADDHTGLPVVGPAPAVSWVLCLPCVVFGADPRPQSPTERGGP